MHFLHGFWKSVSEAFQNLRGITLIALSFAHSLPHNSAVRTCFLSEPLHRFSLVSSNLSECHLYEARLYFLRVVVRRVF